MIQSTDGALRRRPMTAQHTLRAHQPYHWQSLYLPQAFLLRCYSRVGRWLTLSLLAQSPQAVPQPFEGHVGVTVTVAPAFLALSIIALRYSGNLTAVGT